MAPQSAGGVIVHEGGKRKVSGEKAAGTRWGQGHRVKEFGFRVAGAAAKLWGGSHTVQPVREETKQVNVHHA